MIELKPITENNYRECMRLKVKQEQLAFVENGNYVALAKAYVYRDSVFPFAVYIENEIIGFIQYRHMEELGNYLIDKIMIKEKFQGKGYGTQLLETVINKMKEENIYRKLCLCVDKNNKDAMKLYSKLGFVQVEEEEEENEIVLGIKW